MVKNFWRERGIENDLRENLFQSGGMGWDGRVVFSGPFLLLQEIMRNHFDSLQLSMWYKNRNRNDKDVPRFHAYETL